MQRKKKKGTIRSKEEVFRSLEEVDPYKAITLENMFELILIGMDKKSTDEEKKKAIKILADIYEANPPLWFPGRDD